MARCRRTVALFALSGLFLTACGSPAAKPHAAAHVHYTAAKVKPASKAPIPVTVETSFLPSTSQLPLYLALDRGYYRAHGLAVKLTSGKGSVLTVQQVAAGQYDIGLADLTSMAELRAKGAPVKAFMAETDETTFGITASKAAGIKTWKDLYGHRVLIANGNAAVFLLPATFAKLGLDLKRVHVVNVPAANLDTDYMTGQGVGAAGDVAGAFSRENAKRPSIPLWFANVLDVVGYGLFARQSYMSAHPDVIRSFAAATGEAIGALSGGPAVAREAARDMITYSGNKVYKVGMFAPGWPLYEQHIRANPGRPTGWESSSAWRTTLSVLQRFAGLKGDVSPTHYFTNGYLQGAGGAG